MSKPRFNLSSNLMAVIIFGVMLAIGYFLTQVVLLHGGLSWFSGVGQ